MGSWVNVSESWYKGDQLLAASLEKRTIGELWRRASGGNGVYVMAQASLDGMDVRAQLRAALE
jgi:hypothetical protein